MKGKILVGLLVCIALLVLAMFLWSVLVPTKPIISFPSKDDPAVVTMEPTPEPTMSKEERLKHLLEAEAGKPIIYLYPQETTDITVKLELDGTLEVTYPAYNDGWQVTAHADGSLINHADGREYSYLFWEGQLWTTFDFSKGFVIKGCDTLSFLQAKLEEIGLTPKEYNEFIVYWLPQMQDNAYNLISFQGDSYTNTAKLDILPEPDSLLRVFMAFRPLAQPIEIEEQTFTPFVRKGFTVVEWGGGGVK